ncbi:hypothetical protein V6N13_065256 [Hibiscus sabdariffa]
MLRLSSLSSSNNISVSVLYQTGLGVLHFWHEIQQLSKKMMTAMEVIKVIVDEEDDGSEGNNNVEGDDSGDN